MKMGILKKFTQFFSASISWHATVVRKQIWKISAKSKHF